jgi:thiamine-monophosphate kinase
LQQAGNRAHRPVQPIPAPRARCGEDPGKEATATRRDEAQVIDLFRRAAGGVSEAVRVGMGDDAAVLRAGDDRDWVVTQDALVEDVHFRRAWMDPVSLGWKTMAVSLSDLAAMGAEPKAAFLSMALPMGVSEAWLRGLAQGVRQCLRAVGHGAVLAGGDTVQSPDRIFLDGVLMGTVARGGAVRRDTARAGDRLVVTGSVGGSAAGLRLLETGMLRPAAERGQGAALDPRVPANQAWAVGRAWARHVRPRPRVRQGWVLAKWASAMVDLSDGLAAAVHVLCDASRLGAVVWADRIPVDPALRGVAPYLGVDARRLALTGGEDYELLCAIPADRLAALPPRLEGVGWTEVGTLTGEHAGRTLMANGVAEPLPHGYDAFRTMGVEA